MEELFVEAIFWSLGYGSSEKYQRILNSLWEKSEDENEPILLELEARHYEEAMAYLRSIMPEHFDSINEDFFGKCLMNRLQILYKELNIKTFGSVAYGIWGTFPESIKYKQPFFTLNYADDLLFATHDEAGCRKLYESAFSYYD